jgi:exosome complex component RRP45
MREEQQAGVARQFAIAALRAGVRVDGRALDASRALRIDLGPAHGQARVMLGRTVAVASASAVPVTPPHDRPAEGTIAVAVEMSPAASESAALEFAVHGMPAATDKAALRMRAIVERVIRDSRALDTEALCILAGTRVWAVSVDVTIIDAAGNAVDAAHLAAMAALLHARRNDVSISGTDVHVHPFSEREPLPLPIHHVPLTVSYALFGASSDFPNDVASLDPNLQEELASDGSMTIALNAHGEVCGLHKAGGLPVDPQLVARCSLVAADRVVEITDIINRALHESSTKHHSLTTVRPVLVAPEPTAVFSKTAVPKDDQVQSEMQDADKFRTLRSGLSSWNAIPADDAPPPKIMEPDVRGGDEKQDAAERRTASEEIEISHVFRTLGPASPPKSSPLTKLKSAQAVRANPRKETPGRPTPSQPVPNERESVDIIDLSVSSEDESEESDDDLMSAYIPTAKDRLARERETR